MATETATARTGAQKDVHKIITGKIIELLEKGIVPWRTPWTKSGVPKNLISRRAYRGINTILLASLGYERNFFITSKQLKKDFDGATKAEERPHMITYWNFDDKGATNGTKEDRKAPLLRYYTVFNIVQCAGILGDLVPEIEPISFSTQVCEDIVENMMQKPEILNEAPEPFYDCLEDYVSIPVRTSFKSPEAYYSELFHQLAHSTGHHTRLNRMGIAQMSEFGGNEYSLEELVAEIATGYMHSLTGIADPFKVTKGYIKGWLERFKSDSRLVISAAHQAQQAVDFMLNIEADDRDQAEE